MAYSKINIKPSKKGSLRRLLGVTGDKKIPAGDLTDKASDSTAVKKKKNFARNERKWNHGSSMGKLMGKK